MKWAILAGALLAFATPAKAHEYWANGITVPAWVKGSCCGPEDVHRLTEDQVHAGPDGYHVDIYPWDVMSYGRTLPSEDGYYWIFFKMYPDGSHTPVYCFFAPPKVF